MGIKMESNCAALSAYLVQFSYERFYTVSL